MQNARDRSISRRLCVLLFTLIFLSAPRVFAQGPAGFDDPSERIVNITFRVTSLQRDKPSDASIEFRWCNSEETLIRFGEGEQWEKNQVQERVESLDIPIPDEICLEGIVRAAGLDDYRLAYAVVINSNQQRNFMFRGLLREEKGSGAVSNGKDRF